MGRPRGLRAPDTETGGKQPGLGLRSAGLGPRPSHPCRRLGRSPRLGRPSLGKPILQRQWKGTGASAGGRLRSEGHLQGCRLAPGSQGSLGQPKSRSAAVPNSLLPCGLLVPPPASSQCSGLDGSGSLGARLVQESPVSVSCRRRCSAPPRKACTGHRYTQKGYSCGPRPLAEA